MSRPDDHEARIASLEKNRLRDAARIRELEEWVDVLSSPLWKRVLFVIQGYHWRKLGRWYRASWNVDAAAWD